MATIKCKDCGHQVATTSKQCPACGSRSFKPTSKLHLVFACLLAIIAVKCSMDATDKPAPPPAPAKTAEQAKADADKEAAFQAAAAQVRMLRALTKEPASFELVQAGRLDDGTLCVTYKGKNTLGTVVVERKAVTKAGAVTDFAAVCAGKSGDDMTHIKHAL